MLKVTVYLDLQNSLKFPKEYFEKGHTTKYQINQINLNNYFKNICV